MPDRRLFRIPSQRPQEPQHQPWCSRDDHILDLDGFGTCVSADITAPGQAVYLTWQPGEPVQANVADDTQIDIISLDELEQRALAMLTTALIGRGGTPSPSVVAAVTS
ncbi:hypothetical protein [Nonomuraea sp. NPDC049646]|uniref:hypothetical protein n=1 Tax=unclassified Nonomuraea TaxID=2593643 RepID=UPI0037B5456A